jgi:hypothetical protein
MFSRAKSPSDSEENGPAIDTSKRFDVYLNEQGGIVVLRNVKIIGRRSLFESGHQFDVFDKFVELEQADGSHVFVSRHGLIRLCEHGTMIKTEVLAVAAPV